MVRSEVLEPKSLSEACSLLAEHREHAKILAGGQNLLVLLRQRRIKPRYLINIKGLSELEYIKDGGDTLKLGALTTHRALETSALVRERFPMLAELERELGPVQTKNWGTIGGNLCEASPVTDLSPAIIALRGSVKTASVKGERALSLDDFFVDYQKTCLEADELLVEIQLPKLLPRTGGVYRKESVRFADPPIASVAVVVQLGEGGEVEKARIILQAVAITPVRAREAEKTIAGKKVENGLLDKAAELAAGDAHTRSEYKREMIKVLTRDAIREAVVRATRAG